MARAPAAAAPMPADDPAMDAGAPPVDDAAMPADEGAEDQPQVLCTIAMTADGTFTLFQGDEPEAMHGGEEAAEGEDMGGAPAQTFDSIGKLLKAVLDIVQTAADGGESGADQMRAGYAEGDEGPTAQTTG